MDSHNTPVCRQNKKKLSQQTEQHNSPPCVQRKQKQFQTICMHPVHACATSPLNLPHNALEPMPMGTLPLRYFMPLPLDLTLPLLGTILLCPFPFHCPCLAPPMQRLPLPLRLAGGGPSGGWGPYNVPSNLTIFFFKFMISAPWALIFLWHHKKIFFTCWDTSCWGTTCWGPSSWGRG